MSEQRKYREEEVREIFGLAAQRNVAGQRAPAHPEGLTLSELQEIGREAGLEPEAVARAAATLNARAGAVPQRTSLGMPISVGRMVPLSRPLSDAEWEQLVAELRTTFGARGSVSAHGNLREWSNGNLHACIEPTQSGYRLRLGTLKSDAAPFNGLALATIGIGTFSAFLGLFAGWMADLPEALALAAVPGAIGLAGLLGNLSRLKRWSRQREQQMDHIANRAQAISNTPPPDEPQG